MRRRKFITLLGGATATMRPLVTLAQQQRLPVIGYLSLATPGGSAAPPTFMQGLAQTGYIVGQNVAIEYRWAETLDQMPALAAELVRRQPSVIFATPTAAGLAVKAATSTIPFVFTMGVDPVKFGLVTSLNRPGGNATGTTIRRGWVIAVGLGPTGSPGGALWRMARCTSLHALPGPETRRHEAAGLKCPS